MANIKIQSTSVPGKETIYVDVDDEITGIIDKVRTAKGKVIALVLPKRATVLQSVVNMKLLKRTAEDADKNLVLITTEAGLMPLAGSVGLHVADTPSSKPVVPPAPHTPSDEPEDIDEPLDIIDNSAAEDADFDSKAAASKPVGELAGAGAAGKIAADDIDESIDLGDDDSEDGGDEPSAKKPKKNKKLAVPNFDSLRKRLALGGVVLVLLIVGYIFAFKVLPKATITIDTDSSTITTNLNLTLDTTAKTLSVQNNTVPATLQTQQKTATQQVAATGQQNNGAKADGTVKFTGKVCTQPIGTPPSSIQTGSTITANGKRYVVQSTVSFNFSGFSNGGTCANYTSNSEDIVALNGGADYNVDSGTFTANNRTDVTGTGSADGGTDDIIKVVAQSDIDNATAKIKAADSTAVKQQLVSGLQAKGLEAIPSTMLAGDPQVTTSAKAGDKADNVTVTAVTSYTMLGVKKSDLTTLVTNNVDGQLDKGKQVILDDGVANATFTQANPGTVAGASVSMQAKSLAGPQLSATALKTTLAGKKSGDIQTLLKQTPGVTKVTVKYSPFWVNSVPSKASKVTIQIDKSGNQ